jgi:hypothetical protein
MPDEFSGLGSNSNFIFDNGCNPISGLTVAINVKKEMICESVSGGAAKGFGFQLNCYSSPGETSAWQQYALILWDAYQSDWRWCNQCQGFFFAGNQDARRLPRGRAT